MSGDDVFYYNLNIGNGNINNIGDPYNQLGMLVSNTSDSNVPLVKDPSEYYCSIIRLAFSGYSIPIIQFLVQTPVMDVNKGIYSFTLSYGGFTSAQSWFMFIPNITRPVPTVGTARQNLQDGYYNLYDYDLLVEIMNNAFAVAFADLQAQVGAPIAAAQAPFVGFDAATGLFSYYFDKAFYDKALVTPIQAWFNSPAWLMVDGLAFTSVTYNSPTGQDNLFYVRSNKGLNDKTIGGTAYIQMTQQYVSAAYMSALKSVLVTTNMPVRPEFFNLSLSSDTGATGSQSTGYTNVMTDFLPDISQPEVGISTYRFIYNATSLYRVFSILGNSPLYTINASLSWTDTYGNVFPLYQEKGQTASIKFMFVRKSAFKFSLMQ